LAPKLGLLLEAELCSALALPSPLGGDCVTVCGALLLDAAVEVGW
jgi:hypothetical protein